MAAFAQPNLVSYWFPRSKPLFTERADDPRLLANQKLPEVDLNRPAALLLSAEKKQEIAEGKCATCAKAIAADEFKTELGKREYAISGMCGKCQSDVFGEPAATEPVAVVNQYGSMTEPDLEGFSKWGQGLSMLSRTATSSQEEKPSERFTRWDKSAEEVQAYREKRDAPAVVKGTIACQPHYGFGPRTRWFKCSEHGQNAMSCIDDMDKYETWRCGVCLVESTIRCRHYAGFYGGEI